MQEPGAGTDQAAGRTGRLGRNTEGRAGTNRWVMPRKAGLHEKDSCGMMKIVKNAAIVVFSE